MSQNNTPKEDKTIWKDPRFSNLVNDPRFKHLPKSRQKVKIDDRFQSMLTDEKFKVKSSVDKYGRKVDKSSTEDLKAFYYQSSSESESDVEEEIKREQKAIEEQQQSSNDEVDEFGNSKLVSEEASALPQDIKSKLKNLEIDYARGEAPLLSDSSSDEESDDAEEEELFLENVWGELDADAEKTDESTYRIAACNMDWDRIRAVDIMVLCSSFLPPGGVIKKVSVYPSEFGKERMKEEEELGPPEIRKDAKEKNSDDETEEKDPDPNNGIEATEEDAEEDEYHREKLRQYQLNRLKYYYAVIECDTVATADKLYQECDGLEYESTANKLDFRFIPDDVSFDDDVPREVCTEMPSSSSYKPRIFTTTALQQHKVELTWDETDVNRQEFNEKLNSGNFKDISDTDLKNFVACSSESEADDEEPNHENEAQQSDSDEGENSDEDDSEEEKEKKKKSKPKGSIEKYKLLLGEILQKEQEKKQQKVEKELTWGINIEKDIETKKKEEARKQMNPMDRYIEKRREKKKARKQMIKKLKRGETAEDATSSDEMPSDIDMNDPYFAEEFANGEFEPLKKPKKKTKGKKQSDDEEENGSAKAEELEQLLDDDEDDGREHFSLKKIQKAETAGAKKKYKKKKKNQVEQEKAVFKDNFELNIGDDRFKSIFTSSEYNIDPTDPHFKKTKNMETLIKEKLKRRPAPDAHQEVELQKKSKRKKTHF